MKTVLISEKSREVQNERKDIKAGTSEFEWGERGGVSFQTGHCPEMGGKRSLIHQGTS